jgi:hypothetical protein
MARRILTKPKKKVFKGQSKSVINKMLGDVPNPADSYSVFLSYFSQRYTTSDERKEGKSFVVDFMKKYGSSKESIQLYKTSSLGHSTSTMFAIAYGFNNDMALPETSVPWLVKKIAEVSKYQKSEEEKTDSPDVASKTTIQERVSEARSNLIGEILGMIDDDIENLDLYRHLQGIEAKATHVSHLSEKLRATRDELREAHEGSDPQLKEAYPYRAEIKKMLAIYEKLVADCERHIGNVKAVKAPRKKKEKSASDQTKKMVYLKQWPELKLVSIDPTQVIGAMDLWVYNVKYKTLAHYKSREASGFKVRGTTLANYDIDTSEQRALRKPEKTLDEVLKATPSFLKKVMGGLTTRPSKPNGRINENTILLRAFK